LICSYAFEVFGCTAVSTMTMAKSVGLGCVGANGMVESCCSRELVNETAEPCLEAEIDDVEANLQRRRSFVKIQRGCHKARVSGPEIITKNGRTAVVCVVVSAEGRFL
jgi:hypothetical protein